MRRRVKPQHRTHFVDDSAVHSAPLPTVALQHAALLARLGLVALPPRACAGLRGPMAGRGRRVVTTRAVCTGTGTGHGLPTYHSRKYAHRRAIRLRQHSGVPLRWYGCPVCQQYHLST